ncbi:hypothetical protein GQ44DRAFT_587567, partial [Phaeosphaeriaceae sp. PMI808]
TTAALILPLLLLYAGIRYRNSRRKPFPFLKLPQELRDMIYNNLIENPAYPPPPACPKQTSRMDWIRPSQWLSAPPSRRPKPSNWIMLANKQIFREYMDLLCKRATFDLTISPLTHPSPDSQIETLLLMPPSALKELRSCNLTLVTTSNMLGVSDPRNMTSSEWTLARQIRQELSSLSNISYLSLNAKAIGDPLWNPLWIWYHACQSFKYMGTHLSDMGPVGPKLDRITFSLDTWSPGENYLKREGDVWMWCCMQGHGVVVDGGVDMTVREFCAKIYHECGVCAAEKEGEE